MSRSYRKNLAYGILVSNKAFKQFEHRRARRAVRILDLTVEDPPPEKRYGNLWNSPKDAKGWQDASDYPEWLRK